MTTLERERKPLKTLRVVDFSVMISGIFVTMQLADFGAGVVSVEHSTKTDPPVVAAVRRKRVAVVEVDRL